MSIQLNNSTLLPANSYELFQSLPTSLIGNGEQISHFVYIDLYKLQYEVCVFFIVYF